MLTTFAEFNLKDVTHQSRARRNVNHMQCMEVWGGNEPVDSGVVMPGIDAWVYSRPCKDQSAGGDVHYVSTCAGGRLVRIVLADIAGHGERVANSGRQLHDLMRRFINQHDQVNMVRSLNRHFTMAPVHGVFATAVVMTFECIENQLTFSNSGHPSPLWYQQKHRRWTLLEPGTSRPDHHFAVDMPWGVVDEPNYHEFRSPLAVGDFVLCYSDSLTEAKGADGQMLGTNGLLQLARGLGNVTPSRVIPLLLAEIEKYDPDYASRDDVTCLAFRPNGLRPQGGNFTGA